MADLKRKHHRISKGDKVPVLIEEALDDVIIVTLKSGNKEFRGILLDCNKRNIPHGVCFSSLPKGPGKTKEQGVNSQGDGAGESENGQNSVSASTYRYSYNHDPQKLTEKLVVLSPKGNIRPVRSKAVRDIRLRPRQTLCSKCKNMIHENGKGSSSKSSSPKQAKTVTNSAKPQLSPSRHLARPMVALKWGLRKRKYQQEEESTEKEKEKEPKKQATKSTNVKREKPERLTRSSLDSRISQARETFPEVRLYKLEDVQKEVKVPMSSSQSNESNDKEEPVTVCEIQNDEVDSATSKSVTKTENIPKAQNPKATPIIKISFGDGAVLKIPPRLPGSQFEEHIESSSEEIPEKSKDPPVENTNYVMHKKLKKAMKKSKERVRNKSGDHENRSQSIDEKSDKHHRKHKRKHKHRHLSPYESRPLESNVIMNDWNANEDKELKESFDKDSLDKESIEMENKNVGDWLDQLSNEENEDHENTEPVEEVRPRPRLLYTWNNNRGLSRVEQSPKEFRYSQEERYQPDERLPSEERFPSEEMFPAEELFPPEEKYPPEDNFPSEDRFVPEERFSPQQKFSPRGRFSPQQKFSPQQNFSPQQKFSPKQRFSPRGRFSPPRKYSPHDNFTSESFEQTFSPKGFPLGDDFQIDNQYAQEGMSVPFEAAPPPMIVGPYSPISSASEPSEDLDRHISEGIPGDAPHLGGLVGAMGADPQANSDTVRNMKPLMMKIQTQSVPKCVTEQGRQLHVGDIVWGKIQGFPWWPGRVISITVTQKDNGVVIAQTAHVTWFGSSTMSHMQCSDLYPFIEDFKLRFNKKKRGPYRVAIKQATIAAQSGYSNSDHHIDFADLDEV